MPDMSSRPNWQRAADLARLRERGRLVARVAGKQLALFAVGERIYACNNRCPHEGYPLVEGHLAEAKDNGCVLTCNWHNWKFVLASGANVYGGDALRVYPTRVADGAVWVDVAEASGSERIAAAFARLRQAMDENQYDRIARELARVAKAGADPRTAVATAIADSHDRLRDGMTHAYAAADAWLRLHDESTDAAERLTCLAEAVGHIAYDTLREPSWPYAPGRRTWDAAGFLDAVEAQDEPAALAFARGALDSGARLRSLGPTLARAALAHYNDFGHSLIYLRACTSLSARFGATVDTPLLLAYVRSLVRATREDLIPEFRKYAETLVAWHASEAAATNVSARTFAGLSINGALAAALAARGAPIANQYHALLGAAAVNLLSFDASLEARVDVTVADNIGWLDFTHGITFAGAVRETCASVPELWPNGLLQMALFVGRNAAYVGAPDEQWLAGDDVAAFNASCRGRVLNHAVGLYIHSAHLLKTWTAARIELDRAPPGDVARVLIGAVGRYLHAPVHQKRTLRTARQALEFVALED